MNTHILPLFRCLAIGLVLSVWWPTALAAQAPVRICDDTGDCANVTPSLGFDVNNTEFPTAATETTGVPNAAWTWIKTANYVRNAAGTWDPASPVLDPCDGSAKTPFVINIAAATTTQLVAASASNKVYICSFEILPSTAINIALVEDDTAACASPTAGMSGGVTAATGWNFQLGGGLARGSGNGTIFQSAAVNRYVCLITAGAGQVSGSGNYVLAP